MTKRTFVGPAESLRDDVDPLEERERRRDISQRPLHQFALLSGVAGVRSWRGFLLINGKFRQQSLEARIVTK